MDLKSKIDAAWKKVEEQFYTEFLSPVVGYAFALQERGAVDTLFLEVVDPLQDAEGCRSLLFFYDQQGEPLFTLDENQPYLLRIKAKEVTAAEAAERVTEGRGLNPPEFLKGFSVYLFWARALVEEEKPEASAQKRAAFANSVQTMVTGWSGGYGGPSVREHAAGHQYVGQRFPFEEAVRLLIADDGLIFGPLDRIHYYCWQNEHCFDDDPADVQVLQHPVN